MMLIDTVLWCYQVQSHGVVWYRFKVMSDTVLWCLEGFGKFMGHYDMKLRDLICKELVNSSGDYVKGSYITNSQQTYWKINERRKKDSSSIIGMVS